MSCLSKICMNAKKNNYYIIGILHCNNLELFNRLFRNYEALIEKLWSKRIQIRTTKLKLAEMANNTEILNLTIPIGGTSIGDLIIMTMCLKNLAFKNQNYLSNTTMIISKLWFLLFSTKEKSLKVSWMTSHGTRCLPIWLIRLA